MLVVLPACARPDVSVLAPVAVRPQHCVRLRVLLGGRRGRLLTAGGKRPGALADATVSAARSNVAEGGNGTVAGPDCAAGARLGLQWRGEASKHARQLEVTGSLGNVRRRPFAGVRDGQVLRSALGHVQTAVCQVVLGCDVQRGVAGDVGGGHELQPARPAVLHRLPQSDDHTGGASVRVEQQPLLVLASLKGGPRGAWKGQGAAAAFAGAPEGAAGPAKLALLLRGQRAAAQVQGRPTVRVHHRGSRAHAQQCRHHIRVQARCGQQQRRTVALLVVFQAEQLGH